MLACSNYRLCKALEFVALGTCVIKLVQSTALETRMAAAEGMKQASIATCSQYRTLLGSATAARVQPLMDVSEYAVQQLSTIPRYQQLVESQVVLQLCVG